MQPRRRTTDINLDSPSGLAEMPTIGDAFRLILARVFELCLQTSNQISDRRGPSTDETLFDGQAIGS
jgi:hypothetical protein